MVTPYLPNMIHPTFLGTRPPVAYGGNSRPPWSHHSAEALSSFFFSLVNPWVYLGSDGVQCTLSINHQLIIPRFYPCFTIISGLNGD